MNLKDGTEYHIGRAGIWGVVFPLIMCFVVYVAIAVAAVLKSSENVGVAWVSSFMVDKQGGIYTVFFIWLLFGLAIAAVDRYAVKFWKDKVQPIMSTKLDQMKGEMSEELLRYHGETQSVLTIEKASEAVERAGKEELKEILPQMFSKLYGRHAQSSYSFNSFCQRVLGKFYDEDEPHRSQYRKNLTIKASGADSFHWNEIIKYRLHCNKFEVAESTETPISYPLTYESESLYASDNMEEFLKNYNFSISVNNDEIFNSSKNLHVVDNKIVAAPGGEGNVVVIVQDGRFTLSFRHMLQINKPWTDVSVVESSILKDKNFILHSSVATCGADIYLSIPDGWVFEEKVLAQTSAWDVTENTQQVIDAHTKDWVLPGIIAVFSWGKPAEH